MNAPSTVTPPRRAAARQDNRLPAILDATARLFRHKGYAVTSMRDIAAAAGMLAGSLYYHFASKEELLVAVYAEGVRRISASVSVALARKRRSVDAAGAPSAPRTLPTLLEDSDYAQVVIRVRPDDAPRSRRPSGRAARRLRAPVRPGADRRCRCAARTDRRALQAHAAGRAQLVADLVSLGPRFAARPLRGSFVRLLRGRLRTPEPRAQESRKSHTDGHPSQGSRHQDRPRRPRPRQPHRRRAPARCRHGGRLHAAVAGDPGGGQARARGGRRRHRRVVARHRSPDRAQAHDARCTTPASPTSP